MKVSTHFEILQQINSVSAEYICIVDYENDTFHHVSPNQFGGWGWSNDEIKKLGMDYFEIAAHKDDRELFRKIFAAIIEKIDGIGERRKGISYFSFHYRMSFSRDESAPGLLVRIKAAPIFADGRLKYIVINAGASMNSESGSLQLHFRNADFFERYDRNTGQWSKCRYPQLSPQEQFLLLEICRGKDFKNIADVLSLSEPTLRNIATKMYRKLGVNSIVHAVLFAADNQLMRRPMSDEQKPLQKLPIHKRKLTPELLDIIQSEWNKGRSLNAIARRHDISEGAIRYAIRKGRLVAPTK